MAYHTKAVSLRRVFEVAQTRGDTRSDESGKSRGQTRSTGKTRSQRAANGGRGFSVVLEDVRQATSKGLKVGPALRPQRRQASFPGDLKICLAAREVGEIGALRRADAVDAGCGCLRFCEERSASLVAATTRAHRSLPAFLFERLGKRPALNRPVASGGRIIAARLVKSGVGAIANAAETAREGQVSHDTQLTIHEAEAVGVLQRAHNHATALDTALNEAANALAMAKRDDLIRQVNNLRELERLVAARIDLLAERVAEGSL
jgi:hypothetical protein